jgi:SAM-dependent methyltransferase
VNLLLKKIPLLRNIAWRLRWLFAPFPGSRAYWEARYASAGDSGRGSGGAEAAYKAEVINRFVRLHAVRSVIEFGCGDGRMLARFALPSYRGYDVSLTAVQHCRAVFQGDASKSFAVLAEYANERVELALSLDVIYHLVEDEAFAEHMRLLFGAARRFVIIYSSHSSRNDAYEHSHIRQREFLHWIETYRPDWELTERIPTPASVRQNDWLDIEPAFFFFRWRTQS